jgi:hypothetical protein
MAKLAKFAKHATTLKVEFAWLHGEGARGLPLVSVTVRMEVARRADLRGRGEKYITRGDGN